MALTVQTPSGHDVWAVLPGETRWVDYSATAEGDDLVVYAHTFRTVRERLDLTGDALLWKPGTTRVARRYAAGDWLAVLDEERSWPPTGVVRVPRAARHQRAHRRPPR